jgi:alpha-L-fucosidase
MKTTIISLLLLLCVDASSQTLPKPTENQLRWQEMEMYAFIHYSLNTYTDQEWGFGNEDPKLFNPSSLDCRQWARVCKQAGMRGIIFTAKHHCGFCMWPSKYTEYSVKNSPWKNGKGDVVRELADACRAEGLKFAVYLSPWDRNHPDYGKPEYVTYFRNQLRELLTNYGDIFEVWFDGANGGDGWYGGANETRRIDGKTYYGWAETFRMIRELQPNAVIWNDGGDRGDLRWVGTEAGNVGETNWSMMPGKGDTPWHMLHYGVEDGDVWCPGETNTSIRPGWFYHETENEHVKSLSKLMDTYYKSVGRNSTLLLNFPIAPNGRIHPTDSLRGIAFKKMIDEVFRTDLAEKAKIEVKGTETVIDFGKPTSFNRFVAEEDIRQGQRVKKFSLEALVDGEWLPLRDALVEGSDGLTTIGHRRIVCFPTVNATKLRFAVTDSKAEPIIKRTSVFLAPELTGNIPDSGEKRSSSLHYFFSNPRQMMIDWDTEQTISAFRYLPPQNTKDGTVTHYTLWASSDWTNWTKLATGEFSNIVNNPIWQTIKFPATKARVLKFDADRLASGERMAFDDFEVVVDEPEGFRNPVLPGFHADPSVCRAGDDFYLVNSTFQYFPGVPVFHSKDLVNWEQVGNCLTRPSQVDLKGTDGNSGIYAPTIRYNNGRFYMVTTVFPSRRHFYVWTDNPAGEWSEPVVIDFAVGSCDPTLYFEDDKCFFLWKEGDIKICEIDVKTGRQLGEIHHLGVGLGGRYPEGPHIYKKDGYYYLLLAEGGTEHGHHVNILRSKNLFGPYQSNPDNPILSHFNMKMQNSQIQGLGHADLVQAPDSSWWMICLGYRTSGYLQHVMGRETMLAPVCWEQGGWPVVNGDGTLQTDMKCKTLPLIPMPKDPVKEEFDYIKRDAPKDSYHSLGLPMGWMSLCNPDYSRYSLTERKGWLRLRPSTTDLSETASPTFIARRQTELNFTATALFDLSHLSEGMQAGITAYAAPLNHYDVVAEKRNGQIIIKSNVRLGQTNHSEKEFALSGTRAYLRITSDKEFYYLQASSDGKNFVELAKMEYRFLSTETIGGFTGVMLGLFAQCGNETSGGYADVDWFEYLIQ